MRKFSIFFFILLMLSSSVLPVNAQEPEKSKEFVYGMNIFVLPENDYSGKFAPPNVDTIYLLADVTSILSPRYTLVYFWAITNEFKADWENLNEPVAGTLEISAAGAPDQVLEQTKYVIQYPNGVSQGNVQLFTGEEAVGNYQKFLLEQETYRDALWTYYQKFQEYLLASSQDSSLQAPLEPEALTLASTGLNDGFAIHLPAGKYTIQFRDANGNVVPDSKKSLVVFSPTDSGTGFLVIPADKYVTTEKSEQEKAVIYTRPNETLYLQPYQALEFNQQDYSHLRNPQASLGEQDRRQWVYLQEEPAEILSVSTSGAPAYEIQRQPFWVEQLPGSALGYEIITDPQDAVVKARTPDFEAFELTTSPSQTILKLSLVDQPNGSLVASREVRVVQTDNKIYLFLIPFVPLLVFAMVFLARQRFRTKLSAQERR